MSQSANTEPRGAPARVDVFAAREKPQKLVRLEAVRGLAAAYVFVGHCLAGVLLPRSHFLCLPFRFGQEAVMVFFVLSGFVIEHSFAQKPDQGFGYYFQRRFTRIYPILLLALGVAFLLPSPVLQERTGRALLGNVLMLQDLDWAKPGAWFPAYAGNYPLWSLSYEWWFYLGFFFIRKRIPERYQAATVVAIGGVGAGLLLTSPAPFFYFATYFPAWWVGVEIARLRRAGWKLTPQFGLNCAALVALAVVFFVARRGVPLTSGWGDYPGLVARHFLAASMIIGLALLWRKIGWRGFDAIIGPFGRLAGISYGLYVLHYPLVSHWRPLAGTVPDRVSMLIAIAGALLLAWLAEGPYQALCKRLIQKFAGVFRGAGSPAR